MEMTVVCRACGEQNATSSLFSVKEKMFGTESAHSYVDCKECGSWSILDVPHDLGLFYPDEYYSFGNINNSDLKKRIKKRIKNKFISLSLENSLAMKIVSYKDLLVKRNDWAWFEEMIAVDNPNSEKKILDVGCGDGLLLQLLSIYGFEKLTGCDPFLNSSINIGSVNLIKCSIENVSDSFDYIFFHHSLEHMEKPDNALRVAYELLEPNGMCIVRIPTTSSLAAMHYRKNWVQLDAPRHIVLYSETQITKVTRSHGFDVENIIFDSNSMQFWGSEAYVKGLSLVDISAKRKYRKVFKGSYDMWRNMADELNRLRFGDQICLFLRKS